MSLYRIHTEAVNEKEIKRILDAAFDGYTVLKGAGCWKGTLEKTLVIEIYGDDDLLIQAVAEKIKKTNKQQAVLVSKLEAITALI